MPAPPDPERPARVARAWAMWSRRASLREIAAELGVSHETVRQYVLEAREATEWSEVQQRAGKRARMVEFLNALAARGVERLEGRPATDDRPAVEPEPYERVVPALMKVVQELNRVEGNYAPVRVTSEDQGRAPDPELMAALEQEARRAEALDAAEQRRALEE